MFGVPIVGLFNTLVVSDIYVDLGLRKAPCICAININGTRRGTPERLDYLKTFGMNSINQPTNQ